MLRRLVASLAVLPLRMLCYRAATISRCPVGARLSPPALPPATHQAAAARLRRVLVLCLRASAAVTSHAHRQETPREDLARRKWAHAAPRAPSRARMRRRTESECRARRACSSAMRASFSRPASSALSSACSSTATCRRACVQATSERRQLDSCCAAVRARSPGRGAPALAPRLRQPSQR